MALVVYSWSSTTTGPGTEMQTSLTLTLSLSLAHEQCVKVTNYHGSHICQLSVLSFVGERFTAQRIVCKNSHSHVFGWLTGSGL